MTIYVSLYKKSIENSCQLIVPGLPGWNLHLNPIKTTKHELVDMNNVVPEIHAILCMVTETSYSTLLMPNDLLSLESTQFGPECAHPKYQGRQICTWDEL